MPHSDNVTDRKWDNFDSNAFRAKKPINRYENTNKKKMYLKKF